MARAQHTLGRCELCGKEFAKAGMSKHLTACAPKHFAENPSGAQERLVFLISVSGADEPDYWMHLAVSGEAKLTHLDHFLREIWLECCGHLSQFIIGGSYFLVAPEVVDDWAPAFGGRRRDRSMNIQLQKVLQEGMTFTHEYDMGTTTALSLKVISSFPAKVPSKQVMLLARNHPPDIRCEQCGQPAQVVCSQCIWEGLGWLCEKCAREHECEEDMFLPVVNSPRVGMCGYTGGADWWVGEDDEELEP
jgi:hypothetical protein